jgi:Flp pilus assembly pilin Flp
MRKPALEHRRLGKDEAAVTAVEFALLLPVMCIMLFGLMDLGYRMYVSSVVQGALFEAARMATVGGVEGQAIDNYVKKTLRSFSNGADIKINKNSYYDFMRVKRPEPIVQDTAPVGEFNKGDCYEDVNGNSKYDLDRGKTGLGGSDDVVHYEVVMRYRRLFPIGAFIGLPDEVTVQSATPLRNQPFGSRAPETGARICFT